MKSGGVGEELKNAEISVLIKSRLPVPGPVKNDSNATKLSLTLCSSFSKSVTSDGSETYDRFDANKNET